MQSNDPKSYGAAATPIRVSTPSSPMSEDSRRRSYRPPTSPSQSKSKDGERSWLLASRSQDNTHNSAASPGSGSNSRRSSWLPGKTSHSSYSILPTTAPEDELSRRSTQRDVPGQTTDPKDPLNRNVSSARAAREKLTRQDTQQSFVSTFSSNGLSGSISERRNQLHRQNSYGVQPNKFLDLLYRIKELTTSTDSTDEKTASTVLNVVNVVVDAVFCILYLVEASYLTRPPGHESHWLYIERSQSLWHLLVIIASYNFITVCCSVIFSDSKMSSLRSTRHIVSTVVSVPFIISIFMENGQQLYVPYFLQSFALISRVQQALNFYIDIGVSDLPMDPLKSKTIIFVMYIFTLIYCAISAFQIAEYDQLLGTEDHNDLLKLLYFVLITMSTIGYGDVTPKNQIGYAIVILIIIAVVSVFPFMISGIMDALAQAKAGEGIFKSGGSKFMIISGSLHSAQKLANVLNGFWFTNKEYSDSAFKIVIFGLSEPSKDIQALLQSARYKNRVVYLKGTPLESKDLERIQAKHAEGIFIIADRNSAFSSQEEDRHNTLSTLAFRNVSDAGIYTYNLLPESEIYQKMAATQVVCADELRQVLLAFNCLQQASATLILNMLHQHRPSERFEEAWEAEYDDSLGNEFYISYLNPIFDGKPFSFVSWFLYRRFQVILFGVRIRLQSGEYHTALNPGKDYRFQHNEQCIFIAQNPTDLDDINALTEEYLTNFLQHLHKTQEEDHQGIGPDYHANNFSKALLTLAPKHRSGHSTRRVRASKRGFGVQTDSGMSYSRRSGRYQLQSAMPTITNEDDEIDVEPEISFVSGNEDSGADQDPNAPKSPTSPTSPTTLLPSLIPPPNEPLPPRTPPPVERSQNSSGSSSPFSPGKQRAYLDATFPGDELSNARIDYPVPPFPGAKVPLCILVDAAKGGERKVADMVISSWSHVLDQRREQAEAAEYERTHPTEAITDANGKTAAVVLESSFPADRSDLQKDSKKAKDSSTDDILSRSETGHILICSPNYDIFRLICTLRSAHLKQVQDVVVLCSRQPNSQEFRVLKGFPRLYFLVGDCLSRDDLERGAITESSKYLFLRHPENAGVDGSFFDSVAVINRILVQQIFSDAQIAKVGKLGRNGNKSIGKSSKGVYNGMFDPSAAPEVTVATTKKAVSLETLNEGPQCVYELVEERSVEFLQIRKTEIDVVRDGPDNHAPGKVAVLEGAGGPLDNFGPESDSGYYGYPVQTTVPRRKPSVTTAKDFYHNGIYASGGVLVGGLLDHVLYQLYSNPSILQLIKLLCGIRTKADVKRDFHLFKQYGSGCYLECIPVPDGFGVQTIRKSSANKSNDTQFNNGTSGKDDDSSDDEGDKIDKGKNKNDINENINKNGPETSFSRAKSKGKAKITEFLDRATHFHHHHHQHDDSGTSNSIDSDYMYDNRHKNFLHLYEHLALDQGVVPIGLLRLQGDDPKTVHLGIGGNSRCYAITNPLLDTVVLDTDMVFVLTRDNQ
ncbi:potassium channel, sub T, member 1 [Gryganskiella cystojenkinii]|nr:potassium channel, sub T, member 1 [Gryganskiella cystojenkinii]